MEDRQEFQEEFMNMPTPNRSAPSTPHNHLKNNTLQVGKHPKVSPPSTKKSPKSPPSSHQSVPEQKTLSSQQVRIKGQQKLTYLKQCQHKQWSPSQIFQYYPYCHMDTFTFHHKLLRNQQGQISAQIIQDDKGIHMVQEYQSNRHSKYINSEQEDQENTFNGLSVSLFSNGNIFEGVYHNGKCCGLGYELQPNGNTFIGTFKEGLKNGQGTFHWFTNHEMYTGQWQGGLPHGSGTYVGADRYEGSFLNGLKFGFGQQIFSNGDKYIGQYVNSVADGYGEYFWSDGSVYKGDFKQGVRHGYGIWEDQKQLFKGYYRLDKKEGFGIYVWKNKQIYKGQFRDDFRQGYGQFVSIKKQEQKLIYKGSWFKGKKDQSGKVDQQTVKQLHSFLQKAEQFDEVIEDKSQKQKKRRVGHQYCIPKDSYPHKH